MHLPPIIKRQLILLILLLKINDAEALDLIMMIFNNTNKKTSDNIIPYINNIFIISKISTVHNYEIKSGEFFNQIQ